MSSHPIKMMGAWLSSLGDCLWREETVERRQQPGLLEYMAEQYPPCPVNKYVTINRTQQAQFQGDTWLLQKKVAQNVRNLKVSVEQFAPVLSQRKV